LKHDKKGVEVCLMSKNESNEVFLSLSYRVLLNLESLNSVETVGNLVRHRTAPIVTGQNSTYSIRFVPTISGESLAHAYQVQLVEEAKKRGLPLSEESERGEFIKFTDDEFLKKYNIPIPSNEMEIRNAEMEIMLKDYVCDVGGFLYAGNYPVKRTSTFQVGYMIPAVFEVEAAALEAQFHVRHAPSSMKQYQQPYNVEVGSAVYTFTFNMHLSQIATPSTSFGKTDGEKEKRLLSEKDSRVVGALSALSTFLTQLLFGAKRSRFLPNTEPLSAVAALSIGTTFIVSPGNSKNFIRDSIERKNHFTSLLEESQTNKAQIRMLAMDRENAAEGIEQIEVARTPEEFMKKIINTVKQSTNLIP